ncbi:MAG: heterodisulfide reductase-related iron-sulfur binding cluster [Candidatus Binatia bacterium]|nr:heterodisulfide reductase-related iron-sulfur binding cluster [Candidatus Binatia bacterium]
MTDDHVLAQTLQEHVPLSRLLECVHCGLCLPACPTYLELGDEADSPRGRIHLLRDLIEGRLALSAESVRHLDRCLGCLGCESACPSGVRYRELIEGARIAIERAYPRRWWQRWQRRLILEVFPYPRRLAILLWPLRLADACGLGKLVRRLPLAELVPGRERLPDRSPSALLSARGARRHRVAVFRGCVARVLFPQVEFALVDLLVQWGCEVVIPPAQGCCGALAAHQGEAVLARQFFSRNLAAFQEPVEAILVTAAGCGAFLRSAAHWVDGSQVSAAQQFAGLVCDATEFLARLDLPRAPRPLGWKVAYHHACHLAHAQGIREEPMALLRLAGVEVVPLEEADVCCGSAGSYNLLEPRLARQLGARKARHLVASGAEVVAVANPGCALQIRAALRRVGSEIPVLHPVEILAAAYRGVTEIEGTGADRKGVSKG